MEKELLEKALSRLPIPKIYFYEETDSTNDQALKLAAEGAGEFTLVIAERQTAGRGRMGRRWVTKAGASLAFSLILRPEEREFPSISLFSLMGGLAVCHAIEKICGTIHTQVKWPNDVLLDGRKTCGILAETSWQGNQLAGLVLGIGINLLEGSVPPAEELLFPATCIQAHCGEKIERLDFLAAVLEQIVDLRPAFLEADFMTDYSNHLSFVGQKVFLNSGSGTHVRGTLVGVDRNGQLILQDENGEEKGYPIGDLHLRPKTNTEK